MISIPIRIFLSGSLIVSSVVLVATQSILGEERDFTTLVVNDESDSNSSSVNNSPSNSGKGGCSIYLVERSKEQYLGGDSKKGIPRWMGSVSEIIGKIKDPKAFLEAKKTSHSEFVKNVEEKGCRSGSGKRVYVYKNGEAGTYLDDLQRLDWARKLKISESSISVVESYS